MNKEEEILSKTKPTSKSQRLVKVALVIKGLIVRLDSACLTLPAFGFPTQIAKETRQIFSVRITDYLRPTALKSLKEF